MPPSERSEQLKNKRRAELLNAARTRFLADGYTKTSVASIVRAAGVSQGTFYLYFDSKQALLTELQRQVVRQYEDALRALAQSALPVDERLARAVEAMVRIVRTELALERVFREAESADTRQRAALRGRVRLAGSAMQLLGTAPLPVADPEMFARVTITIFDSLLYEALAYEDAATLARAAREGLRFVLAARGTPAARSAALCAGLRVTEEDER